MNFHEDWMCSGDFEKCGPLLPSLFIDPFSPVERVYSLEESVHHNDIVADDHLLAGVRLLLPPKRSATPVEFETL